MLAVLNALILSGCLLACGCAAMDAQLATVFSKTVLDALGCGCLFGLMRVAIRVA